MKNPFKIGDCVTYIGKFDDIGLTYHKTYRVLGIDYIEANSIYDYNYPSIPLIEVKRDNEKPDKYAVGHFKKLSQS